MSTPNTEKAIEFQNLSWLLSHPGFWFTLLMWVVLMIAVVRISQKLWRKRAIVGFILFLAVVAAAITYYSWLSVNAYSFFIEGSVHRLTHLNFAKRAVVFFAALSSIWLVIDWVSAPRSKP